MLAFDASAAPDAAARSLLSLGDPVPTLAHWSLEAPRPALARALHATLALLRSGRGAGGPLREYAVDLSFGDRQEHFDLLLLPSIFTPEVWSTTFLEGLLRKPLWQYQGRTLLELGTGSGWISLVLLRLTGLARALGVDLNPHAAVIARINAVLNGFDRDGNEREDKLARRFEAMVSDLLDEPRRLGVRAHLIVGCIPQVIARQADLETTRGLYDLSNYFVAQGVVEDQFGLGLNARALRESLQVLEPGGSVILNLGGRPGWAVVQRMFQRRGFEPEVPWRARIQQAGDTDIAPLAELEARSNQLFAFHLHVHSSESISARLAQAALQAGKPIFHELLVVEGRPRSDALLPLATALSGLGMEGLWEQVDLSTASDEQLRFVTRLAEGFRKDPRIPYPHEAGDLGFRRRVADFLHKFHHLPLGPGEIFAGPDRQQLLRSLLMSLVEPGEKVAVSEGLRDVYGPVLAEHGADAVWVHGDLEELPELLELVSPRLVLLALGEAQRSHRDALATLLRRCEELSALLCLDESERFEITSRLPENPILTFLAQNLDSAHLAVLCGLVRSRAFPDVQLALLLTRHARLFGALEVAAEVTYSRISWFHQAYYDSLFDELLSFRVNAPEPPTPALPASTPAPPLRPSMLERLSEPAFARPPPAPDVIRLDYGENELPVPPRLLAGILRGFLTTSPPPAQELTRAACGYLRATRLPRVDESHVLIGQGTLPLLFDAIRAVAQERGRPPTVVLPTGSYGVLPSLIAAAGGRAQWLRTRAPDFLVDPGALPSVEPFDVLLLTHPANPSGAAYPAEALAAIIRRCAARGARVMLDEVFGMLADLDGEIPLGHDRLAGLEPDEAARVLVLCGVSKEFAAGGLRLGLAATTDAGWLRRMRALQTRPLPLHVQVAAIDLFARFDEHRGDLELMRQALRKRRSALAAGLRELGVGVSERGGGALFLLADLARLGGEDAERFVLELEENARVRLNTPSWAGLSHHARACFALPQEKIDEALSRLRRHLVGGDGT